MISHRTETKDTAPSRAQRLAQTGDVFFQTVRPYQRNNYLFEKPDNNYVFSTGYAQMRPKIDAEFLMCFLQTDSFVKVVLDNCTGTSYPAINSNDLSNLEISLPVSEDEQREIGGFITNIDNLITLHQCKGIFENYYFVSWEQRKLSEIADKAVDNRGKTPTISEGGTHPLLEVASLGNGTPDYSKVTKYLSDETFETELRAYIKEGDILFSTVGSIGLVSLMDTNENAAIAQNIVAFRANKKYDSKFLYAMLSTEDNQYKAQRIVMGAVQPSIKVSQLVDVEYCVTENIDEQRKLGDFFLDLDNLITLHQRSISDLVIIHFHGCFLPRVIALPLKDFS